MPPGMQPCTQCQKPMDPTRAVYSKQGELICSSCESDQTIREGYVRAANTSAGGAIITGVVSLFINPFFILSIAGAVQSIRAIALLMRPEYKQALGGKTAGYMSMAVVGLVLSAVTPIRVALAFAAIVH